MTTKVVYDLVGYDRETERMAEQHSVPPPLVNVVKQIAGVADMSDYQLGAWELTEEQARKIAQIVQVEPNLQRCDYFLEPSAAEQAGGPAKGRKATMAK